MSIKSKADWLRGFLESLEYSDTISKRQIQLLKEKLNLLLEEIEENEFIEDDDDDFSDNQSKTIRVIQVVHAHWKLMIYHSKTPAANIGFASGRVTCFY